MLLIAIALSFLGIFIMFFCLLHNQDKVIKTLNRKHTEFFDQLNRFESTLNTICIGGNIRQTSPEDIFSMQQNYPSRNNTQPSVQQNSSRSPMQHSTPQSFSNGNAAQTVMQHSTPTWNAEQLTVVEDAFPSMNIPNAKSENVMIEDVFPLQQNMIANGVPGGSVPGQEEKRVDKNSMLELLQL